jgi:hypothetical protein
MFPDTEISKPPNDRPVAEVEINGDQAPTLAQLGESPAD